jgi:hypothetical protein
VYSHVLYDQALARMLAGRYRPSVSAQFAACRGALPWLAVHAVRPRA